MDADEARRALASVGMDPGRIEPVLGGWANWTFEVDSKWIARFPRNAEVAAAAAREQALLPELSSHVSFQVPAPTHEGTWSAMPFMVYRRIEGVPLTSRRPGPGCIRAIGEMLAELHSFPLERATRLLQTPPAHRAWSEYWEDLWPIVEEEALPAMSPGLAGSVSRNYERFLAGMPGFEPALVHHDLGLEHILVDAELDAPRGLIDFEDAWVGDPAIDYVPLRAALGEAGMGLLLESRDLGEELDRRMWSYRWMGSIHAIIYGVREGNDQELASGLAELPRRLHNYP